jgi:poly-gamma-glutamate capsule biosynthesis protein CapA/YwtB (metallophosphatase superfamily)
MREAKSVSSFSKAKKLVSGLVVAVLAFTYVSLVRGQGPAHDDRVATPVQRDAAKELSMKIAEPFTFAAVGDIIIRRPVAQLDDPGFQALVKVMRAADMTYANMEGPIIDQSDPNYHGPKTGGPKTIIDDLKTMGIRVMTTSNNHTMDGGSEGMFMTNRFLDEAQITHAGSGKDLAEARDTHIGITPKGTIGVLGIFSIDPGSYPPISRTSDARNNWPGVNPLHVTPYNVVTSEQMSSLRKIRDASFAHRSEVIVPVSPAPANESPNELFLFGSFYKVGENVGSLSYAMDPKDLSGIMQSIRIGKQNSDFMIVAIHCHENSFSYQAYSHDNSTPDFLISLAHKAIDNGADVFVGHGIHTLRGVEIYKGKPIFYGVSNFFYQEGPASYITDPTPRKTTEVESSWGGAAAGGGGEFFPDDKEVLLTTSRYEGGKLVEVRLYPADLGIDGMRPLSRAGDPTTPTPEQAQRILKHLQEISKPFGTTISIENNVGVIHVGQVGTKQLAANTGGVQ